jgi:hypothetical protein
MLILPGREYGYMIVGGQLLLVHVTRHFYSCDDDFTFLVPQTPCVVGLEKKRKTLPQGSFAAVRPISGDELSTCGETLGSLSCLGSWV